MPTETLKLYASMDLAEALRECAREDGLSLSMWLQQLARRELARRHQRRSA